MGSRQVGGVFSRCEREVGGGGGGGEGGRERRGSREAENHLADQVHLPTPGFYGSAGITTAFCPSLALEGVIYSPPLRLLMSRSSLCISALRKESVISRTS